MTVFGMETLRVAQDFPRWKQWAARILGDKIVTVDEVNDRRVTMTGYRWRGCLYVTSYTSALLMPDKSSDIQESP